jgi:hypothetical protein
MESDRRKWRTLVGINLIDRLTYQISMTPSGREDKDFPDTFRIILNNYLKSVEAKSLAPDGTPCAPETQGLLGRTQIVARRLTPMGKETDRRWEQGEDPSMLDFEIRNYEKQGNMVVADVTDRKRWSRIGVRRLQRESGLS